MRAKEYIAQIADSIGHLDEVSQALADLTPLRLDKQATDEYFNHHLSAHSGSVPLCAFATNIYRNEV